MRFKFFGFAVDRFGNVIPYAKISIYLAGTTTPARVYTQPEGGTPIETPPQITANEKGYFEFWIDINDYDASQLFDIKIEKEGYETLIIQNVKIIPISRFTELKDTIPSYTGLGKKFIRIKETEDGLEAVDAYTKEEIDSWNLIKNYVLEQDLNCGGHNLTRTGDLWPDPAGKNLGTSARPYNAWLNVVRFLRHVDISDEKLLFYGNASRKYIAHLAGTYRICGLFPNTRVVILDVNGVVKEEFDLNVGEVVNKTLSQGDKIYASYPINVYYAYEFRTSINLNLLGCRFVTYLDRYNLQVYLYSPYANCKVHFRDRDGTAIDKIYDVSRGKVFKIPDEPSEMDGYMIESSAPIAVYKHGSDVNDTIHFIPVDTEWIGKSGGTVHIVAVYDNTTIKWYADDGSTGQITLNALEHATLPGGSQYTGRAYRLVSTKPFFVYNEADGDGVDQTPFIPPRLASNYYVLPTSSEFIAFASKRMFTVSLYLPDGTWKLFKASGSDANEIFGCRIHASDLGLTSIPQGTIVVTDQPTWAIFEDYSSNNETIWWGVRFVP